MNMPAHRFVSTGPDSPIKGVRADQWQRYIAALEVQPMGAISDTGALGAYAMSPRRLEELGYANGLRRVKHGTRMVQVCDFILPWTRARFLTDAVAQLAAFTKSNCLYHAAIMGGEIKIPDGCSMAGALAILHVGGTGALEGWPKMFDHTQARYDACNGIF